ncbi:MAG TPA: inositol monophosphatase [Woeseiaceae bacterium]|nr:inositol monophosphatase [Woeseiaceae bacterium]
MTKETDRLEFACDVAKTAGTVALEYFADLGALTVRSKGVQDMATEADINTEKVIRREIAKAYPDDAFLGEESSESFAIKPGAGTWIVDPIDGTQPFISGMRTWCVSIAYYADRKLQVGVVYDPTSDELYAARRGGGASLNGHPMRVAEVSSLGAGLVGIGYSTRVTPEESVHPLLNLLKADGMFHRCGSGALSLAYVAAGRLIGYFEPHMCPWDFAAGALLVQEAGGLTNDCLPTEQTLIDGGPVLAAAGGVYDKLEACCVPEIL